MQKQRQAKIVAIAGQSGEREQYLIQISSNFDAEKSGRVIANYNKIASIKNCKISEYKIKKWVDYKCIGNMY